MLVYQRLYRLFGVGVILLMADGNQKSGDHHLGWLNPISNGINYLSTAAGFQPSTV